MMKAVRLYAHGGPDMLVHDDVALPEFGSDDLLVRVALSSVSGWDVKYRKGALAQLPGRKSFGLPMQPGRDAVGTVEAVGVNVRAFKPGDPVIGLVHPANPASPLAMRGLGNLSTDIDLPGHTMFGGNAQFVARPQHYWLPLPACVAPAAAAAALWAYATAHRILRSRLAMGLGDTLLVIGASGGMGTATLDLARGMGVRVIAATRSPDKLAYLRERADATVLLDDGDLVAQVRALAGGGLDGAVDYSGSPVMVRLCIDALRPGGTLAVVAGEDGAGSLPVTAADCVRLELNLRGARGSTVDDQRAVLALLEQGRIAPEIHAILPMAMVAEAHRRLEGGTVLGRILLDPWSQ